MTNRIPCSACGAAILHSTAEKTGGLCMPCKGGYRKSIEESKARYERDKKYRETAEHKHWLWLVDQVYKSEAKFSGLSHPNQLYFATNIVSGEVYNGGFDQYFHNSSGDYYQFAVEGLTTIKASESLRLLISAKQIIFGEAEVPSNTGVRREAIGDADPATQDKQSKELGVLDRAFWADPDKLGERLSEFAQTHELRKNF